MLTGITLENFKAFKDPQFIPIKPITLVFGPNSAGKSSIMHALAFLKHVYETKGDCDPDKVEFGWEKIHLGSWQNLVHGHDLNAVMKITLHWKVEAKDRTERALTWEFKNGECGPYVSSFILTQNGKPVTKGKNTKTKGILWSIELHSKHRFWSVFINEIWQIASGQKKSTNDAAESLDDFNGLNKIDEALPEITQNPRLQNFRKNFKSIFAAHFSDWLSDSWHALPIKMTGETELLENLLPGINTDHVPREYGAKNSPIWRHGLPPQETGWFARFPAYEFDSQNSSDFDAAKVVLEILDILAMGIESASITQSQAHQAFDMLLELVEWEEDGVARLRGLEELFASHLHVGAFRKIPEEAIRKRSLPVTVETKPWLKLLENAHELAEHGSPEFDNENLGERPQSVVNEALRKLKIPYRIGTRVLKTTAFKPIHEDSENQTLVPELEFTDEELVFQDQAGASHPVRSLGSGVGVILPVVVVLATNKADLLSIEEPESHIHPRLQAELGDIVISAASGKRNKSVIIETHSEHLILRILRRIRETTEGEIWPAALRKACPNGIRPEDVSVLYVNPPPNGSNEGSTVIELPVDANGEFTCDWPGGFFEERMKEFF